MEIFYTEKTEFNKKHSKEELSQYADVEYKHEKRFYEHSIGRYLIKTIAEEQYGIKDTEILTDEKGKPYFKNNDLYFSISHTSDIVMVCFDKHPCGIDIEQMKERDFEKLGQYYKTEFNTREDFYKFWTLKEAAYKLDSPPADIYALKLSDRYYITVVSTEKFETAPTLKRYVQK